MKRFSKVNEGIDTSQVGISEIYSQIEVCDRTREEVVKTIKSLAVASEINAAPTEETAVAMDEVYNSVQELNESAKKLKEVSLILNEHINFFK